MPSINMIAPRRAEKRKLERDMRRLVIVILAEFIFVVGLAGWLTARLMNTKSRIDDLEVQLVRLRPIVAEIEDYENATSKFKPKLDLLNEARARTMLWYNVLDALTCSLPQSTYLTRIATKKDSGKKDQGLTVMLSGITTSQALIGETMLRLSNVPDFEGVDLMYSQPTSVSGAQAILFELGANIKADKERKGAKSDGRVQS
ncbi:MAG: PilN domain-containing protein [Armatimonadota bacterium]